MGVVYGYGGHILSRVGIYGIQLAVDRLSFFASQARKTACHLIFMNSFHFWTDLPFVFVGEMSVLALVFMCAS